MNRFIRIILVILMMFWLLWIPAILYFLWTKPKGGASIRFLFWVMCLIPGISLIGGIGLLLIETKIINVDHKESSRR